MADLEKLQEQLSDLQGQLAESNEQIKTLENALAEKDAQIEAVKAFAEQIKQEAETGQPVQSAETQPSEVRELQFAEGIEDILGDPVEITPNSLNVRSDIDVSQIDEGDYNKWNNVIVH